MIVFIGEGDSKDTINIGESGRLILSKEQRDRYLAFVCERGIERIRGYWFDLVEYDDETWEKIPYCHEVLTIVLPNTDVHTHYRIRSHSPLNHEEIESVRRDLLEGVNVTKKYKNLVIEKAYML